MYWTLELAQHLEDAPWPATKDELIDYAIRSGAPLEVIENLQELEDEGEAYERKLREAGVPVTRTRYNGMIHDFVMLDALSGTVAARQALAQATDALRTAFLRKPKPPEQSAP